MQLLARPEVHHVACTQVPRALTNTVFQLSIGQLMILRGFLLFSVLRCHETTWYNIHKEKRLEDFCCKGKYSKT